MEESYAIINSNVVENVIVADSAFAIQYKIDFNHQYVIRIDNLDPIPGIGWLYDGSSFSQP